MSALEDVKRMQEQGLPEDQIIKNLQDKGISYREISEALTQSKIKAAVETPLSQLISSEEETSQEIQTSQTSNEAIPGMQKSMLQPIETTIPTTQEYTEEYAPQYEQQGYEYPQQGYEYHPYDYQLGISPDTITEISEQVVSEKISEIRKHLEKVIDFKTTVEAKTEAIEERLQRIEKIIDGLQASVLRKVGDYITNVDDIKKELIETQKSFAKLVPEIKKQASHHKEYKTSHKKSKKKKR